MSEDLGFIVMTIIFSVIIIFLLSISALFFYNNFFRDTSCLEKVAQEFCEKEGIRFEEVIWYGRWQFSCIKKDRTLANSLNFFESELEKCN